MASSRSAAGDDPVHPLLVAAIPGLSEAMAPPTVLSRNRSRLDAELVSASQRWRLLIAAARVMASEGYAATTIQKITSEAGVSKKTFYKFFPSKEGAFLACYDAVEPALAYVVSSADGQPTMERTVETMVSTYLTTLSAVPALARLFLFEALTASPEIRRQRATVIARFGSAISDRLATARQADPSVPILTADLVTAMLGGVNELCVDHLVAHGPETLPTIQPSVSRFVLRVLGREAGPPWTAPSA